ncbi:MAG TPA: hypothetical protein VFX76_15240, partial [Roseiflexaceae bacterium]|nr:hypothetical protein [Roseiflexaceae bacterium]
EGARVVLQALAEQQPNDPRIWLAMATAAATRSEQRAALERALELDPDNQLARRALERFTDSNGKASTVPHGALAAHTVATPVAEPHIAPAEDVSADDEDLFVDEETVRDIRWPLYLVVGVAVLLVLLVVLLLRPTAPSTGNLTSTPELPGGTGAEAQLEPTNVVVLPILGAGEAAPTFGAPASTPAAISGAPALAATPTGAGAPAPIAPTAAPIASPIPVLVPGQVVESPPWTASLLRPEYAIPLDGAIGSLQPRGRFVLALIAVGNSGPGPARIPNSLFTLQDQQGNQYTPVPDASTIYLDIYGRGQRGELSLEEALPADGGLVSVPLIFDVPPDARGLSLRVGDQIAGWPIGGAPAPAAP